MEEKKVTIKDVLGQYVKHKNGAIFHMSQAKNKSFIYLRARNNYYKKPVLEIKQGLVDGTWLYVNEGELKRWMEEDNAYIQNFTRKLLKRNLLAQLLTELDDDLIADNESDKRLVAVLKRSNKETERIAAKMYDKLYHVDKFPELINEYRKQPIEFVEID